MIETKYISANNLFPINREYSSDLSLEELEGKVDNYTLTTFKVIQAQSFKENQDYFICLVKEGKRNFYFDAAMFIEDLLKRKSQRKEMRNPLTRCPIKEFEVYRSSPQNPGFKFYMKEEEFLKHYHYCPLLWNDSSKSPEARRTYILQYLQVHQKSMDPERAIALLNQAIQLGSVNAMVKLGNLYKARCEKEKAIYWLKTSMKHRNDRVPLLHLFYCALASDELGKPNKAYKYYLMAAEQKNLLAISEVIKRLEDGIGIEKNQAEAMNWRKLLPEEWKDHPIESFFKDLWISGYDFKRTDNPYLRSKRYIFCTCNVS